MSRIISKLSDSHEVGLLVRAIHSFKGQPITRAVLQLAPRLFVQPGELRPAEWSEFDIPNAMWRISAARTKLRREHMVPLSRQILDILRELQVVTGGSNARFLFPSVMTPKRCISENAIETALYKLGYSMTAMTGNGFRTIATMLLFELGRWPTEIIKLQIARTDNRNTQSNDDNAERLAERRQMMQWWSDYLDSLRDGAEVVPLHKKA